MPDMLNQLHDEIDTLEDLSNETREIVFDVMRNAVEGADLVDDLQELLPMIAEAVEIRLAEQTTKAVQLGAGFAHQRDDAAGNKS